MGTTNLNSGYWKRDLSSPLGSDAPRSLSISFRTLKAGGVLLSALEGHSASTVVEVDAKSRLFYRSSVAGKPEINMTATGVTVDDGQWHTVRGGNLESAIYKISLNTLSLTFYIYT